MWDFAQPLLWWWQWATSFPDLCWSYSLYFIMSSFDNFSSYAKQLCRTYEESSDPGSALTWVFLCAPDVISWVLAHHLTPVSFQMMFLRKILLHSVSSPKGLLGSSVSVTHRLTVRSCRNSRAPISKHIIRTLRDKIAKPYMPPDLCPYPSLTSNKVKTLYSPDVSDINQLSSNQRRVELQEWPHQRLRALLRSLPALVNQRTPKISSSLLDDLDAECLRRLQHKRIPTQDVVLIADVFVACGYYHGLYHTHLPEYLHLHWEEFSFRLVDILQILFLTCISRCGHVNLFAHIEDFLQNCSHLTGNEAALICSAFYVNRCRLQSMDRLAAIFLRELREGLSDLSGLHSLTKMLSQSSFLDVAFLDDLAEVLMEERLLLQVDPLLSSRLITLWSSKGLSHPQLFSALLRLHPPRGKLTFTQCHSSWVHHLPVVLSCLGLEYPSSSCSI